MKNYLNYSLSKKFAEFLEIKELEFETDNQLFIDSANDLIDYDKLFALEYGEYEQSYTFEDVIDFFIEKFNVHIEVNVNIYFQDYNVNIKRKNKNNHFKVFDTKHEAIEYGIEKVIEILTENKNENGI